MNFTKKHGYGALASGTLFVIFAAVLFSVSFQERSIADAYICGGVFATGIILIFFGQILITRDRSK